MKKISSLVFILLLSFTLISGCSNDKTKQSHKVSKNNIITQKPDTGSKIDNAVNDNYRTYYEVFLYSFYDSNGDGIGDINGLVEKLDYINDGNVETDTDLGFNGIYLMPIMTSNTYHKYAVEDYYSIDPQYGTFDDFDHLIRECNKRGIKVIIDLVLNHTSSTNPWFQSALKSLTVNPCGQEVCSKEGLCREHNPYVKYYNFVQGNPLKEGYYPTGIGDWYYEGVFNKDMPDLNLSDEALREELEDVISFWLSLGVDGFRLDAVLNYYNDTEKNIEVLKWVNDFVKQENEDNYLVAEVWTNFSTYAPYYKSGIPSVFDFAFAKENGIIAKTINLPDSGDSGKTFGEAMLQVQEGLNKYSNTAIDAPFFTNHDTARAAGYFGNDIEKIKLAAGMNLMMSGNVFVYYGEEIGMSGSGKDENKRAPMYWSNADLTGVTKGPENMDKVISKFGSVSDQEKDPLSIYQYYKRAIRLRNENPEIAKGEIKIISDVTDSEICAITKTYQDSSIIILYNMAAVDKRVRIKKSDYNYEGIRGYLTVNGEEVTLESETVSLPPYSIVILK